MKFNFFHSSSLSLSPCLSCSNSFSFSLYLLLLFHRAGLMGGSACCRCICKHYFDCPSLVLLTSRHRGVWHIRHIGKQICENNYKCRKQQQWIIQTVTMHAQCIAHVELEVIQALIALAWAWPFISLANSQRALCPRIIKYRSIYIVHFYIRNYKKATYLIFTNLSYSILLYSYSER